MKRKNILIAGPCAVESQTQIKTSIENAKIRSLNFMRMSLWKPRTRPGFEGLGEKGIKYLIQGALSGINPATEVLLPSQAELVMESVLIANPQTKLLLWIGARNQNHHIQRDIAKAVKGESRVFLMVKNQPWPSEDHWEGIVEHVLSSRISEKQIILCHRGFIPNGNNPKGFRNPPDFGMAMRIKEKFMLPMIFDPSHTGGSVENVIKITKEAEKYNFDGLIVEVHHNPKSALTDAKQQLTWKSFDKLIQSYSKEVTHYGN